MTGWPYADFEERRRQAWADAMPHPVMVANVRERDLIAARLFGTAEEIARLDQMIRAGVLIVIGDGE